VILVITSLFIFILTTVALNSFEDGILENKLASNFKRKNFILQVAESELQMREAEIHREYWMQHLSRVKVSYQKNLLSVDSCHKKRYQITVTVRYQGSSIMLHAIDDFLDRTNKLICKNEVGFKRVYWSVIN